MKIGVLLKGRTGIAIESTNVNVRVGKARICPDGTRP